MHLMSLLVVGDWGWLCSSLFMVEKKYIYIKVIQIFSQPKYKN
jgi:hypothetical protein